MVDSTIAVVIVAVRARLILINLLFGCGTLSWFLRFILLNVLYTDWSCAIGSCTVLPLKILSILISQTSLFPAWAACSLLVLSSHDDLCP